jgi:hypothetical protein
MVYLCLCLAPFQAPSDQSDKRETHKKKKKLKTQEIRKTSEEESFLPCSFVFLFLCTLFRFKNQFIHSTILQFMREATPLPFTHLNHTLSSSSKFSFHLSLTLSLNAVLPPAQQSNPTQA